MPKIINNLIIKFAASTPPPIQSESYNEYRHAEDVATMLGLIVVKSDDLELQIDIDSREKYTEHIKSLRLLHKNESGHILLSVSSFPSTPWIDLPPPVPGHMVIPSSTEDHYHVYLALSKPLPQSERINLQFMLGSDPGRESLNTKRLFHPNGDAGILLFETPADAQRILWWRGLNNNLRKNYMKLVGA